MNKYIPIALISSYFLVIFEETFFSYFRFFGTCLNLILIFISLAIFFEDERNKIGIITALISGIILDIFSSPYIGFFTAIFIILYFLIKKITSFLKKSDIFSFSLFFTLFFFIYKFLFLLFKIAFNNFLFQERFFAPLSFNLNIVFAQFLYNFIFAVFLFFLITMFSLPKKTWHFIS